MDSTTNISTAFPRIETRNNYGSTYDQAPEPDNVNPFISAPTRTRIGLRRAEANPAARTSWSDLSRPLKGLIITAGISAAALFADLYVEIRPSGEFSPIFPVLAGITATSIVSSALRMEYESPSIVGMLWSHFSRPLKGLIITAGISVAALVADLWVEMLQRSGLPLPFLGVLGGLAVASSVSSFLLAMYEISELSRDARLARDTLRNMLIEAGMTRFKVIQIAKTSITAVTSLVSLGAVALFLSPMRDRLGLDFGILISLLIVSIGSMIISRSTLESIDERFLNQEIRNWMKRSLPGRQSEVELELNSALQRLLNENGASPQLRNNSLTPGELQSLIA